MAANAGKLLILAVAMMVVVTQATPTPPACPRISIEPCRQHLLGQGPMYGCCHVLAVMHTPECQCWVMESISNAFPDDVDKEYAVNLPSKCGTMQGSCSDMIIMPYM